MADSPGSYAQRPGYQDTEIETGKVGDQINQWRRLLSVFDNLNDRERNDFIRLGSYFAKLDSEDQIVILAVCRRLGGL